MHRNQWRDLIHDPQHGPSKMTVWAAAVVFADHAGGSSIAPVFVVPERGAERGRMSLSAWKAAVRDLQDLGWLTVHTPGRRGPGGKVARYWLTIPAAVAARLEDREQGTEPVDNQPVDESSKATTWPNSPELGQEVTRQPLPTTNPSPSVAGPVDEPAVSARPGRSGEGEKQEKTGHEDVEALAATLAAPVEAVSEALEACEADPGIRSPRAALLGRVPAAQAHLQAAVARHATRTAAAARRRLQAEELDRSLVCAHGTPRGRALTRDGAPVCPMCRQQARTAA